MKVSKRAQAVPPSATIAVTARAKELKAQGVDVVSFGNFPTIRKKSKIVNCSDNIRSAFKVRDALDLHHLAIYPASCGLIVNRQCPPA